MIRPAIFGALVMIGSAAQASDTARYVAAPDWVKPAPPVDAAKLAEDAPIALVNDTQQRFDAGEVWTYHENAMRAASDEALARIGTVKLTWYPDHGDLIVHRVDILRGGERIDLLKAGSRFTVLRREQQLEQMQIDGMLTATLAVEGLRVGDVLDIAYSTTNRDPALKGNVQGGAGLAVAPLKAGYTATRLLWPNGTDLHWRAYPVGAAPVVTDKGGWHELVLNGIIPKQPDLPADAPLRFRKLPFMEASSFADWNAVSKTMAPLYATDGLIAPGSPLAAEVDQIAKTESDPLKRTALALALVQGKVRYLYKGLEGGNYVPQTPAQTWSLRYGDCKAKTLLLLAVLHALKIEAEPILANIELGDFVSERLPSAGAFNHVLVHARVGGDDLYLDGTDRGAHLEDIHDVPPFHWVLPLRAEGAGLLAVPMRLRARPDTIAEVDIDESNGIDLPSPFTVSMTMRGATADLMRTMAAQGSKEDQDHLAANIANGLIGRSVVASRALTFDAAAGTATMTVKGITFQGWEHEEKRYRRTLDRSISSARFTADRSRPAWKDIPVATGVPRYSLMTTRVHLPDGGAGFTLDGDQSFDQTIAGNHLQRKTVLAGGMVTIEDRVQQTGAEIAPADIAAERAKLATAQRRLLRISTATGYPAPWAAIVAEKKAHRFDATLALYAAAIADRPDEAAPYLARAGFLAGIFEWRAALADYDKAISIAATPETHLRRAAVHEALGERSLALADAKAALALQPSSQTALARTAWLEADQGHKDDALALVQERIDEGGTDKASYLQAKADVLARLGDKDAALASIDEAIQLSPGNPSLLNMRCWLKGTMQIGIDTALKDCTQSIELGSSSVAALDSRAMVYFRMNRLDEALTDLNAALDQNPSLPASLYMRGVIHKRQGDKTAAADLAAARLLSPQIDTDYARYGIVP